MSAFRNEYIFEDKNISTLTYIELLKHSTATIDTDKSALDEVIALAIDINAGVFAKHPPTTSFPTVSLNQIGTSLIVSCPCNQPKNKLCAHQSEVLYQVLMVKNYRIFFDDELRYRTLLNEASAYGLETEDNLDDYFQLSLQNKSLDITTKIKEIIKIDTEALKQKLLPKKQSKLVVLAQQELLKKQILVIRKHRYYAHLVIEIYEGDLSVAGKIKNPINLVEPVNLIWKTTDLDEVKFYTAVSKYQNNYETEKSDSDSEALQMIARNPLQLPVFYHDKSLSEKISANSIVPIQLATLDAEVRLSVFKKDPFYEITGQLFFKDKTHSFKDLEIQFNYFVLFAKTFYLVANPDLLRLIEFFKQNNEILLIHHSKFDEFKQTILANLEQYIRIDYAFIKAATKKQLAEQNFNNDIQKIIYLSDVGSFVSITPVMRYGNIEIAVSSRKQIFDTDQNGNVFKVERNLDAEIKFISILAQQHPDFEEQLNEHDYFYLHKDKFLDENWFLETFEQWRKDKVLILGFNDLKKNKLNANKAVIQISIISGIDWFNAELKVSFGKQKATIKQLHKAIRNKSKFVQLDDGTLGILPEEWIKKIAQYFQLGDADEESLKIPKINFSAIGEFFDANVLSQEITTELADYQYRLAEQNIREIEVPAELKATLRPYQREGLNWLNSLDDLNFGACLADDMGLGKTIQIIAFILSQRHKHGHQTNLVVVPTSLLFNWQAEVEKFAPSIKITTHYGVDRKKTTKHFEQHEIVLTTYGMLLSDIGFLKEYRFNYIFLDESQAIKNPNAERYKAARLLQSRNKVVLTGTPIENNTFDLYGQLSFACPGLLGSKQYFKDIYATPIDRFEDSRRAKELQLKIKPFMLRRTKKQVAKELPEKTEMVIYCEMNEVQRNIYNAYERELRDFISAKDETEITKNSMHVLTGLTKLRQICNSPVLLKEGYGADSAKIEVLMEQIESLSGQHKILVFSQFVSMLDLIKAELIKRNIPFQYLTGQTKNRAASVDQFQEDEQIRVFLISLKAGGTGLNLTEADYVYLVDPWWNPAVENQAIDRIYRIGQKKNVIAVRLICPDTIEEKIMKLQKSKTKLADDLIKTDGTVFKSLTKDDLLGILS